MFFKDIRRETKKWPPFITTVVAALAAFSTYTCMYAFRKAFAAGTYDDLIYFSINYKVWLVLAQIVGYTASKFYGIRFISEIKHKNRGRTILLLITFSWISLLGFALVPAPYNIPFLFLNGFPLGMIWGLVFSYLEGRRTTEFMGAVMSVSMIFGSGFVKTIGRSLIINFNVNEFWMPFLTGLLFIVPLVISVFVMEIIPRPDKLDRRLRAKRIPMKAVERRQFFIKFLPGILLTIIIYTLLTIMRDVRDNFEVEIWYDLGISKAGIYASIDTLISIIVLIFMGLLILIKNNIKAFALIHLLIISGCLIIGVTTYLYHLQLISATDWMILAGLGLYMGYLPYNAIFFERMIASFAYRSNVGFVMYLADAMGYLGSVGVLLFKQFGDKNKSWASFFEQGMYIVAIVGGVSATFSLIYFVQKSYKHKAASKTENLELQYV